ncbi:MAG: hypothetical protein ACKVPJ_09995 [Chitinophagales bacterium]
MNKTSIVLISVFLICVSHNVLAQTEVKKFTLNGSARALAFLDNLEQDLVETDTVTAPKSLSSHTLVDLGMKIKPGDNIEIQSMVRIRNDFGGFWGSGVTFDVRQLYVKGIIKDVVRYQVGDINYKLTPYTFYNTGTELAAYTPAVFSHLSDQINYDNFYSDDNTWRQQGAAVDFGIVFKKYIQEINWNVFTGRVAATNGSVPDRLFTAANMTLVQSKYFDLGVNYTNLYDFNGTASTLEQVKIPVTTVTANAQHTIANFNFSLSGEAGKSTSEIINDSLAPVWSDNFFDSKIKAKYLPWNIEVFVQMKSVGADFRSPGAQTKRISFNGVPAAYERITNDQIIREFTMLDLLRESDIYNLQLQNGLMEFDPKYDNITPYGEATPNRQGFVLGVNWSGLKSAVTLNAAYSVLSEVRGQGTLTKRDFTRMEAGTTLEIGKLLKIDKKITLDANTRSDATTRAGEAGVPSVDLQNRVLGIGISAEVVSQLEILLGIEQHTFSGFEFTNQVNAYDEIINFNEYIVDGDQQLWGAGLRWNFSEKTYIMGQFNQFSWNNFNTLDVTPSYKINDFAFIYSMKF